jgi:hypothetical protein
MQGYFSCPSLLVHLRSLWGFPFLLHRKHAQTLLTTSSVVYAAWFGYGYLQAFYLNPDPQSPIASLSKFGAWHLFLVQLAAAVGLLGRLAE